MAPSSYHKLDDYPASNLNSTPEPYNGSKYNNPADIGSNSLHSTTYGNTHNSQPYHPVDPPSKPLVQPLNTQAPRPLKLSSNPSDRLRQRKYQRWRRVLRIGQALTNIVSAILSIVMAGIMIYVLVEYLTTKSTIRNDRGPWPKNPKVWPTIMLLVGAGLTLLLSLFTLISYCINSERVRRSWKLTVIKYAIHILVWIMISFLYRYEKGLNGKNNDLWGWACSEAKSNIQEEFRGVVEFAPICKAQATSWEVSIAEVVIKVLFAVGHFVIYRKKRADEKTHLAEGIGDAATGFAQDIQQF